MLLSADKASGEYQIKKFEDKQLFINDQVYSDSLVLCPHTLKPHWPVSEIAELTPENCQTIMSLKPDIVIIGVGDVSQPCPPAVQAFFNAEQIGIECMNTISACRTYQALCMENRNVVAGLIL